jgi:hypothetical protein
MGKLCGDCAKIADRFWQLHAKLAKGTLNPDEAEEMKRHPFHRFLCPETQRKLEGIKPLQ